MSGVVSSASPMRRSDTTRMRGLAGSDTGGLFQVAAGVIARWHRVPHRAGPGRVAARARDDMDMELRHDIAERRDIDLVAVGERLERAAGVGDLAHQLRLFDHVEIGDFRGQVPARHQQQPGVGGVLDQEHAAERHVADGDGVALEQRIELPVGQ